ncbi:unnamed protein product [Rotaria sp. Silwood1]|nr:unnamed protein product [Rotaria sp. Silwood1]CAF3409138.1 unnamed protein product [Rotaria sp. Silwood1]CAF4918063.1 unnamed protein product [Rotaria sp. Silwood1]
MLPLGWLHVNGVSLSTDIHQQTSDYRAKHVTTPTQPSTPPMISSPNSIPFTTTMIDGQQNIRQQYHRLENADLPKRLFIDRQIKKVKSLPGLIKGTALSRHMSLHSAQNENPTDSDPSTNGNHNYALPVAMTDNDNDSSPSRQHHEQTNETRRPRVSFSEFNKIQFIEDNNEFSQQQSTHRRHRHRSSKKTASFIGNSYVSPPSIQHSQTLHTPYRPSSRQQPIGQELNIKKQLLFPSPRAHSSRITHFPDILNQSLPIETSIHEKYVFQREKGQLRLPEPATEIPINSSSEISRESTRAGGTRSSALHDYYDQNNKLEIGDGGFNSFLNSSSLSSSSTSRQRSLRTISLRQQFNSPIKLKTSTISNNQQIITNSRRSASLKHLTTRLHLVDDDHDDIHNNGLSSTFENRPMTGLSSSKHLKHNYIIHFNSKNSSNGHTTIDSNEKNRHVIKSNFHESPQERFQNVLKIVRPPYVASINSSNHDLKLQANMNNNTNGSVRSSRTNSERGSHEFHIASNTIIV